MIIANESSIDITMKFHFAMAICDGPMEMECSQSAMIFLVYNEIARKWILLWILVCKTLLSGNDYNILI